MKLEEIASKIKDHLQRFEADKTINVAKEGLFLGGLRCANSCRPMPPTNNQRK